MATGLWKPLDKHPLILAIAIKQLVASAVFTSPAELRAAMTRVRERLETLLWAMQYLGDIIERADKLVFVGDRAAWGVAYADIPSEVIAEMQQFGCIGEDGGNDEPSPR